MRSYPPTPLPRSLIAAETAEYVIPLSAMRQAAACKDALPDAPAGDGLALGLVDDAWSGMCLVGTVTNNTTATEWAQFAFPLPPEYVAGGAISLRLRGRVTALAAGAEEVEAEVRALDEAGGLGAAICSGVANLTAAFADKDLTITPTGLSAGDVLLVKFAGTREDTGGATAGRVEISKVSVILAVKG